MKDLTSAEIKGLVDALHPVSHTTVNKVMFSPLEDTQPASETPFSFEDLGRLGTVPVRIEVMYGSTMLPLRELLALRVGAVIPLHELCDDLVDLYVNGRCIGRGEVVAANNRFGVKIVTLDTSTHTS